VVTEAEKYFSKSILSVRTPLPDENLVTCFNREPVEITQYQHFIGCLNYLSLGTRPDISYAVNYLARYSQNPQQSHWRALIHLVGYVKATLNKNCWRKVGGVVFCDNKTAILVMEDNASRGRLKHLDRQFFYSNEMIRKHDLKLTWTKTTEQQYLHFLRLDFHSVTMQGLKGGVEEYAFRFLSQHVYSLASFVSMYQVLTDRGLCASRVPRFSTTEMTSQLELFLHS
ncbi:uncharacterized protein VP01_730g3, partial [Puccinia sorghi]